MLVIRRACSEDYKTIVDIMMTSTTEEEVRGFVPPERISSKFLEELAEELSHSDSSVIIAEKDKVPLGVAYYTLRNNLVEIEEVDVIKEYHNQGIGRALVERIEKIAKEKGMNCLVTGTSINKEGKPWKAYGFWVHTCFLDTRERIEGTHGLRYVRFVKQIPSV